MPDEMRNPALAPLRFLIGDWTMRISDAVFLPGPDDVVEGHMSCRPVEEGRLLVMSQHGAAGGPPMATWMIGRDGGQSEYVVLYADERGVSRVYRMTMGDDLWRIWRDDPAFSQRFEATISAGGRSIE